MLTSLALCSVLFQGLTYPPAPKGNVVDDYHGVKVADPYRWLEQPIQTPEVRTWADAQTKLCNDFFGQIKNRDVLMKELLRRANFEKFSAPVRRGRSLFFARNDGLQNQNVIYFQPTDKAMPRVLLDPNGLSKDNTVAVSQADYSLDGSKMLYGLSRGGSDWTEWHVRDVKTGKDLPDIVKDSKFGVGFLNRKGDGFYYLRFERGKDELVEANAPGQIMFHRLGTNEREDKTIWSSKSAIQYPWPATDDQRNTLFIFLEQAGSINNDLLGIDLTEEGGPIRSWFGGWTGQYTPIGRNGNDIYVLTTKNAPRGKVIKFSISQPGKISNVFSLPKETINGVNIVGGKLLVNSLQDAKSALRLVSLDGKKVKQVPLPGLGTVGEISGDSQSNEVFYSYQDLTMPLAIFSIDARTGQSHSWRKPKLGFDISKYVASQIFYKSKDGTRVPMFIVHKRGLKLNGQNPTILYGYGGFGVSTQPWFSTSRTVWMDMGGVYAIANIRGGAEYGKEWHEAAIKQKRQKAYDDFIAAAETLIAKKYTSKKRLAINGGSNGGLLVGVCEIQRPDLFAAAMPEVGVMDLLRFNQFTIGKAWESDYGSPQNPAEFASLIKISPLHTIKPGVHYPPTLITTADRDDRVVPAHSFKFAARMQACQGGNGPIILRIETTSGHGSSNLTKGIEGVRDTYAFAMHAMGLPLPKKY